MKRGSGHTAYPSRLLIRLSKAMLQRVQRSASEKGQTASTYVRLALVDALQRDMKPEVLNVGEP
jgi:predicted DNA-binding protein